VNSKWAALFVAFTACSDIQLNDSDPQESPDSPTLQDATEARLRVTHAAAGDGSYTAQIDATSRTEWVGLDLDAHSEADAAQPGTWDLAFQRFHIRAQGEVATLAGSTFAAVSTAPASGFETDQPDGADANSDADTVLETAQGGWYGYDPATHQLSAKPLVYVVKSDGGRFFKVELTGYYDAAGTPAVISLRYAELAAPPAAPAPLTVSSTNGAAWVYLSFADGIVTVADPLTSLDWDVAISRTRFQTNSGTSGSGQGGAQLAAGNDYAAIQAAPATGYQIDGPVPVPGPPGSGEFSGSPVLNSWYDYDVTTHAVSPKPVVFLIRTASGGHAKLRIAGYASAVYTLELSPLPVAP
jgi:hypothetical protein